MREQLLRLPSDLSGPETRKSGSKLEARLGYVPKC